MDTTTNGRVLDIVPIGPQEASVNVSEVDSLNQSVDQIFLKVDQLELKLIEVEQFYSNSNAKQPNSGKGGSNVKDKDREKFLASFKKRQHDSARREASAAKRMQELMRQFGTILRHVTKNPSVEYRFTLQWLIYSLVSSSRFHILSYMFITTLITCQITQMKWAKPFMEPVDVVGLGLHDYYEVIEKPMDFSTIKSKMEAKDGNGYKNVREICKDVRLIFKNAMKYNGKKDDVHVKAQSLLDKFETKWLQFLPKVDEEEKRRKEEEAEMALENQLAQEASYVKMAKDLSFELDEVDTHLEELREIVLQKCRKMSTEEKKRLGSAITQLSPEDINKALEIIAQSDPDFQVAGETVEVNIDAQSEYTLWKLKFFVKDTLRTQMKNSPSQNGAENNQNGNSKRKREICNAIAKTKKRSKKLPGKKNLAFLNT